jgi:hypothetical protein
MFYYSPTAHYAASETHRDEYSTAGMIATAVHNEAFNPQITENFFS